MKEWMIKQRWFTPLIFFVLLLINYLSASGTLFSSTQQEVSDKYVNLLAPIGFTFSIWSVIYLGVFITIGYEFFKHSNQQFVTIYQNQIKPLFIEWMLLNILWIIAWSEEFLLMAVILIAAYARTLLKITRMISQHTILRSHSWILKWPVGIHTGWIVFATFANLTTYGVSMGMDGIGRFAVVWTIGLIIVAILLGAYFYAKYGNEAIMLPILWGTFGIVMKHRTTEFIHANRIVMFFAIGALIVGMVLFIYLTYLKSKQKN